MEQLLHTIEQRVSDESTWEAVSGRMRRAFDRFVTEGLLVRQGEGARTGLLFAQLLLSSSVFILGRTVRDTLFLSRYSLSALPWMFVLYGVASALTVVVYGRVADKLPRTKMIVAWCALGAATYVATWSAARAGWSAIYPVFYVWSEVFGNLLLSQFWTLANDLHDTRSARRLFGIIGSARVLGVVLTGLLAGTIVRWIGTQQLLFVLAALLAAIAALAVRLDAFPRAIDSHRAKRAPRRSSASPSVAADRYVQAIALMFLCTFSALTIGDYQFKAVARATFREDALAQFFSLFYAGAGAVSFLFQLFVSPRLLARYGVAVGMSVMPTLFGAASAALLFAPALPVATAMKFSDNGLQYTIHESTVQALYGPFAAEAKVRTRAFLDAVIKPVAYALGGVALLVFARPLGVIQLSFVSIALVVVWLAMVPTVRRRYLSELERSLAGGRIVDHGEQTIDPLARSVLVRSLESDDPRIVLAALDALSNDADPAVLAAHERLTSHEDPAVRVAALERLGPYARSTATRTDDEAIASALSDHEPAVRAAAARAHAEAAGDDAVDALAPLLEDPDRHVRTQVVAALVCHAGFEGSLLAGARVAQLVASPSALDRADAAIVLGELGAPGARRLATLLEDRDRAVVHAALVAARRVADPRLVAPLLRLFERRSTRREAGSALAAIGAPAVEPLAILLADPACERSIRLEAPRVLRQIPSPESWAALVAARADRDSHLRLRVFAALSKLRTRLRRPPEPIATVRALVEREIAETLRLQGAWEQCRGQISTPLLEEEIQFRVVRGTRRVLRALELRYPPDVLQLVRDRIEDPARRANAIELLDTTLDASLRPVIMPFFDDTSVSERCAKAGITTLPTFEAFSGEQCRHPNPYVAALWLDALSRARHPLARIEALAARARGDVMVREVADATLRAHAEANDPQDSHEDSMPYSTIEKLLVLRAASIFERLRGEDLAPLASVAEVEDYAGGDVIFAEGDPGDALFVIARGRVEIAHGGARLATLGVGEAFGEMAVLDQAPRSASATAIERTEVLRIGSDEFYEVLREQSEIAEGVIRMLSRRLREANASRPTGERASELPMRPA